MDEAVRSVIWLGDSRRQVKSFPPEVRRSLGSALYDAQKGEKAPSAKPFKGVGSGVFEIAIRFQTDAYRMVYAVQIGEQRDTESGHARFGGGPLEKYLVR